MLTATCTCGHDVSLTELRESSDCAHCGASFVDLGNLASPSFQTGSKPTDFNARSLETRGRPRSKADHSAAHEQLLRQTMLALSPILEVDVFKLTQWSGETNRGTRIRAGMVRGAFDLFLCAAGRAVWLDAKTGNAVLTPEQILFQARIRAVGGIAEPFRSVEQAMGIVKSVISEADPAFVARIRASRAAIRRIRA